MVLSGFLWILGLYLIGFRSFAGFETFHFFADTESFIVPQEVPSLLSLVYSNIPPIKKGN